MASQRPKPQSNTKATIAHWDLFTTGLGAVLVINPDTGLILHASSAAAQLLNYEVSELESKRIEQVRPDSAPMDRWLEQLTSTGGSRESAAQWLTSSGETRWIDTTAAVLPGSTQALLLLHDVTDYKLRAQELRQHNKELERLTEQLSTKCERNTRILAGMSHEIRTPMHAIMAFAELMERKILGPLTNKQQDAVHNIRKAGDDLMTLLNDVIDLHRAEVGRLDLHRIPVPLRDIIHAAHEVIRGLAWEKDVEIAIQIQQADLVVAVDERRVKQVLYNLLSNAINASSPGQQITVRAQQANNHAAVSVSDHGPGIPPEYQEKIFEEFTQYANGAQSGMSGGLGLAVSRNIVELHGEMLTVSSEVGEGSTFTFTLPLAEQPAED